MALLLLASADSRAARAPIALVNGVGKNTLWVASAMDPQIVEVNGHTGERGRAVDLPSPVSGAVRHGSVAYLTTPEPRGRVLVLDLNSGALLREWTLGHTPMSPVLSDDGDRLFVANRFDKSVSMLELPGGGTSTVAVAREPVAVIPSDDGNLLFVANHLPEVRQALDDENPVIAAEITVIDVRSRRVLPRIELPNGSQGLRGIGRSPDGRWIVVTHVLSQYTRPTWSLERGAMNRNVVSLLDARALQWAGTVSLDDPEVGAANPWAVGFLGEGESTRLLVSHAGTHELSVIDFPQLLERLDARRRAKESLVVDPGPFLHGIRRRVILPVNGPRCLTVADGQVFLAGFFSDDLARVDLRLPEPRVRRVAVGPVETPSEARSGEQHFNDATFCFQQWQSCATCHPDGRTDALYWDLLNDGLGNSKDTKSLLMSGLTPPVMWRGVRRDARAAIQAGMRHILFADVSSDVVRAIEAYLLAMRAVPSPWLLEEELEPPQTEDAACAKCHNPGVARGVLTPAARRGKFLFEGKAQCAVCHPHPAFTSQQQLDPGLGSGVVYDVPSLVEAWRTAPYLHGGEAMTLEEAIRGFNHLGKRGRPLELSDSEFADLLEYVRSL